MKPFIPYEKMSKKRKKEVNASSRRKWSDYGIDRPVTKSIENKKRKTLMKKPNYMKEIY